MGGMKRVLGLAAALTLAATAAWAGGSGLDEQDDADAGTPFFGFVKDLDARGRAIPDAKVVAFDGVGHIPHMERPQPFLDEVKTFLDAP